MNLSQYIETWLWYAQPKQPQAIQGINGGARISVIYFRTTLVPEHVLRCIVAHRIAYETTEK